MMVGGRYGRDLMFPAEDQRRSSRKTRRARELSRSRARTPLP
jgi:hypothetical protein